MGAVDSKQWRECCKTNYRAVFCFCFPFLFLSFSFHCRADEGSTVVCKLNQIVKWIAFKRTVVGEKKMRGLCHETFHFFSFLRSQFQSLYSFANNVNQTGFPVQYLVLLHEKKKKENAEIPILRIYSFYHWLSLKMTIGSYLLKLKKKKYQLKML